MPSGLCCHSFETMLLPESLLMAILFDNYLAIGFYSTLPWGSEWYRLSVSLFVHTQQACDAPFLLILCSLKRIS